MTDEQSDKFKLKLEGLGLSMEKDVEADVAAAIVSLVMGGAAPLSGARETSSHASSSEAQRKVSLREFLTEVSPSTNNEKITTIGVYLHDYKSKNDFDKDDIEAGFRSAREPLPSNLTRDISRTVGAGWLDAAEENGRFYVTNTGSKKVLSGFGRQPKSMD